MTPLPTHPFRPRILASLKAGYDRQQLMRDVGAGITVGIIALPLAMAFAIAAGLKPEQGIATAIVAGFLVGALGGSNVQISGPAGAFIVVVFGIVERYGVANLMIATMLSGGLLFALGLFKLGSMVRYIPVSIVIGFTNGIAILIALSQVKDLLGLQINKLPSDFFTQIAVMGQHLHTINPWAVAIGLFTFIGMFVWPQLFAGRYALPSKFTSHQAGTSLSRIPSPIIAMITMTSATALFGLPVDTIGSRFGGIPQGLPSLALPEFNWGTVKQLFIPTLTITFLGAIESLLCARMADNLVDIPQHDPNQELMAQGIANVVTPLFGGMPSTGTIARTSTNARAGARTPVAAMIHAITLLAMVLVAAPLAVHVPLAALAGILMYVAWNMGEWHEFVRLRKFSMNYRVTLLATFFLTVVFDLMVAVEVGLVMACVFFVYRMNRLFSLVWQSGTPQGMAVAKLYGTLFFGAVGRLETLTDHLPVPTRVVVLEMHRLVFVDTTGVDALVQLRRGLAKRGIDLVIAEANEQPASLFERSGFAASLGALHVLPTMDAVYAIWQSAASAVVTPQASRVDASADPGPSLAAG